MYVEDEPFLARIVCDVLKIEGYEVMHIDNGTLFFEHFIAWEPDLCLLDVMLPGINGYDLAGKIRSFSKAIPIIFLSAKVQTEDIVKGFRQGGNDYLRKPFSIDELLIRIDALLTRFNNNESVGASQREIYYFGNCTLDTVYQTLITSTGRFALSYKETILLEILVVNANQIVERSVLLQQIWGNDDYYTSRSMDVHLTQIRKRLSAEKNINIMNLRGIGYKLLLSAKQ